MPATSFDFGNGPVPAHRHGNGGGWVADSACVTDTAFIGVNARVYDDARVSGDARVTADAWVFGDARVSADAHLSERGDYLSIAGLEWSITWTRSDDCLIIGCQRDTVANWRARGTGQNGEYNEQIKSLLERLFPE
jgi:hypothetical protein